MTTKTIRVTMTGPDQVVTGSLDSFARYHGWSEASAQTREEVAQLALHQFILRTVRAYNVAQAQAQAGTAAAAAVEAVVPLTTLDLLIE